MKRSAVSGNDDDDDDDDDEHPVQKSIKVDDKNEKEKTTKKGQNKIVISSIFNKNPEIPVVSR